MPQFSPGFGELIKIYYQYNFKFDFTGERNIISFILKMFNLYTFPDAADINSKVIFFLYLLKHITINGSN